MTIKARIASLPVISKAINGGLMLAAVFGLSLAIPASAIAQDDCGLSIQRTWLKGLVATATVSGPCNSAKIDLAVRNSAGDLMWSTSHAAEGLFGFDGIEDTDSMGVALADWLGDYADDSTSSQLPEWPTGVSMPNGGEFPFYVADGIDQPTYEAIRIGNYPMLCYIQGQESTLCLIRQPRLKTLINVGAQSFPG
ncbi:hypothetical protein IMCC20628_03774 [Hoeflea sp. IMCC20628]|uniref:hypothetical protein n=1 Tax=Hoeflea sp. IMCC20628 TaxID=1620421 RepID=UPI00063AA83D|nr:hypothetical protein [Hoeflea sp. IMCC20628]AKI02456.1 hypothetical protein IMCC20628_03774 [Hoeflea sp. IMCC20628]